jgi:hypothetical protein
MASFSSRRRPMSFEFSGLPERVRAARYAGVSWVFFSAMSCLLLSLQSRAQVSDQADFFESKVRPILSSRCYSCHTGLKSGGLRLDSRQDILKGGNDGAVIVPGHPEDSLLVK